MLTFFTDPYKDEVLYGAISRYHYYIGNIDFKDTLREVFGKDSIIPNLNIMSNLAYLSNNLGGKYSSDYLISNHSIFPFYSPFLPKDRRDELLNIIKSDNGNCIYTKMGLTAGGICKKTGIYYCPICSEKEIKEYGEAYIHRVHQLQGIFICPHHGVKLQKYKIDRTVSSRIEFIRLDERLLDFNIKYEQRKNLHSKLLKIAKSAIFLLDNDLSQYDKDSIFKRYRVLLYNRGFLTTGNRVKQQKLHNDFIYFYGNEVLEELESAIDKDNEYNWLKVVTRNSSRTVHPIRHILLINFLVNDIKEFFNLKLKHNEPFGQGPWLCLNPAAAHYKEKVVKNLKINPDYKTRLPVGTFTCNCGFIYSRRGPDKAVEDKYKIGRIKEFGYVWENKLRDMLNDGQYKLRELARIMKCDPKTVIRYDKKLGVNYFQDSKIKLKKLKPGISDGKNVDIEVYKDKILKTIIENPNLSRTEIRALCKKEYSYLYSHDKKWLFIKLPQSIDRQEKYYKSDSRVDWTFRDLEILEAVKQQYEHLILSLEPVRVTKSYLGKSLGILPILENRLDKIPRTKEYLESILESVEDFRLRRSMQIIDEKLDNEDPIKLWEVQRLAGIRTSDFNYIKDYLSEYLERGETYY